MVCANYSHGGTVGWINPASERKADSCAGAEEQVGCAVAEGNGSVEGV